MDSTPTKRRPGVKYIIRRQVDDEDIQIDTVAGLQACCPYCNKISTYCQYSPFYTCGHCKRKFYNVIDHGAKKK